LIYVEALNHAKSSEVSLTKVWRLGSYEILGLITRDPLADGALAPAAPR
jgi:hypothetical protein